MKSRPFPPVRIIFLTALLLAALTGCNFPTRGPELPGTLNPTIPPQPGVTAIPQTVNIYLIALSDNGRTGAQVGCGDSVVPVPVQIGQTQGVLRAALEQLLSIHQPDYGPSGLYNALSQSDLSVAEITIENGVATIHLNGALTIGGVCDAPRVQAQLEQTALQFSTVQSAQFYINGVPLQDALSGK